MMLIAANEAQDQSRAPQAPGFAVSCTPNPSPSSKPYRSCKELVGTRARSPGTKIGCRSAGHPARCPPAFQPRRNANVRLTDDGKHAGRDLADAVTKVEEPDGEAAEDDAAARGRVSWLAPCVVQLGSSIAYVKLSQLRKVRSLAKKTLGSYGGKGRPETVVSGRSKRNEWQLLTTRTGSAMRLPAWRWRRGAADMLAGAGWVSGRE